MQYTTKVKHWCLGQCQDLNALEPSALGHLYPNSVLDTNASPINNAPVCV